MRYTVSANITISVYTKVEASSEEEAISLAHERAVMELPANHGGDDTYEFVADMLDGEPENFVAISDEE